MRRISLDACRRGRRRRFDVSCKFQRRRYSPKVEEEPRYVENDGVRIAYYINESKEARKPPVFLLNGWTGTAGDWGGLRRLLARSRRVITMDNRGVGLSDAPAQKELYSIEQMADDVAAIIKAEEAEVDLVGFSMGGLIGQSLAVKYPQYIRKLALASTTPGGSETEGLFSADFFQVLDEYGTPDASEASNRRLAAAFLVHGLPQLWVSNNIKPLQRAVDAFISGNRPHDGILGQKSALSHFNASRDQLAQIACPTLILHGDSDPVLHPQCASLLLQAIPTASILLLANTGHHAYIQEPLEWMNTISTFFDEDHELNTQKKRRRSSTRSLLHFDERPVANLDHDAGDEDDGGSLIR